MTRRKLVAQTPALFVKIKYFFKYPAGFCDHLLHRSRALPLLLLTFLLSPHHSTTSKRPLQLLHRFLHLIRRKRCRHHQLRRPPPLSRGWLRCRCCFGGDRVPLQGADGFRFRFYGPRPTADYSSLWKRWFNLIPAESKQFFLNKEKFKWWFTIGCSRATVGVTAAAHCVWSIQLSPSAQSSKDNRRFQYHHIAAFLRRASGEIEPSGLCVVVAGLGCGCRHRTAHRHDAVHVQLLQQMQKKQVYSISF